MSSSNNANGIPLFHEGTFSITVDTEAANTESIAGPIIKTKIYQLFGDVREITGGFIVRCFNGDRTIKSLHVLDKKNVKSIKPLTTKQKEKRKRKRPS